MFDEVGQVHFFTAIVALIVGWLVLQCMSLSSSPVVASVPAEPTEAAAEVTAPVITLASAVATMRAQPDDARIAEINLEFLLSRLSADAEDKNVKDDDDVNSFVPTAVVTAMRAHAAEATVAKSGCAVIAIISKKSLAGKRAAVDARAPGAVVEAMRSCARDATVARMGCAALFNIATNFIDGQQAAVDEGAPKSAVDAMRMFTGDAGVALEGCSALAAIASLPSGRQAAVDAGAPEVIVAAMLTNASNSLIQQSGCEALANIVNNLLAGHRAAIAAAASAAVVSAMRAFVDDADVADHGCLALNNFAVLPAGKAAVIAAGGREAITRAIEKHNMEHLQRLGRNALMLLERTVVSPGSERRLVEEIIN